MRAARNTLSSVLIVGLTIGGHALAVAAAAPATRPSTSAPASKPWLTWRDARKLAVEGKGWNDTEAYFDRLPAKAKGVVTPSVWNLSKNSAGMCIRFITNSERIAARWTLTSSSLAMNHMPATGVSGLDLYVHDGGVWKWIGIGRVQQSASCEAVLANGIPAGEHEYALYLPLYNGVKSLEIGIEPGAALKDPAPRGKPIVIYGTSIAQGGCASRPGMVYSSILGRQLGRPTINLGFSGSGKMEPAMADLLSELDAAAYVLDCLPNMTTEMVTERFGPFVEKLHSVRPATPIIAVENTPYTHGRFLPGVHKTIAEKNAALRKACDALEKKGIQLTYVRGDELIGTDGEGTVDGVHATDLGFLRFAAEMEPIVRKVVGE